MKIEFVILAVMPFIGFIVGLAYFQGLWLTISRFSNKKNFAGKLLVSFVVRLGMTIFIFYYFMRDDWKRLILMLGGFLIARQMLIRRKQQPFSSSDIPNVN